MAKQACRGTTQRPTRPSRNLVPLLVAILMPILSLLSASPAAAFCEEAAVFCANYPEVCTSLGMVPHCHREITQAGLSFMRRFLLERVVQSNLHMDHEHFFTQWPHFDGCDFTSAGHNINGIYLGDPDQLDVAKVDPNHFVGICLPTGIDCSLGFSFFIFPHFSCGISIHCDGLHSDTWGVIGLLDPADPRPGDAAGVFGYLLHPAQDFYSHSNWLEIFQSIGVLDPPLLEPTVDLWFTQPWRPLIVPPELLNSLGVDGVVLTDEDGFGDDWSFSGNVLNPVVATDDGQTFAAVISDINLAEDECVSSMSAGHPVLNKDSTKMHDFYHPDPADHFAAAELATRQTMHEWCRVLNLAREHWGFAGVSIPMAFWVDPNAVERGSTSPHPPATPCAATPPGPVELTVDVDQIKVLNDTDDDDPGELNFVLALYTQDLRRSTRKEVNSLGVNSGEVVGDDAAPGPVTLCLNEEQANAAIATVQGWDDDSGVLGELNEGDQALRGVSTAGAVGVHTVASPSMEVTLAIQRAPTDADGDGLPRCDEEIRGTNPLDPDTDDDGLNDGAEVTAGTNPLDDDSDDDGMKDGADNCPLVANSGQEDYENDGVGDGCDTDDDNDGVADQNDAFPHSDLNPNIMVGSCNSGIPNNHLFANGANFNDLIGQCSANANTHGAFVSCVSHLTNEWQRAGLIPKQAKSKIMECAAQAIP